LAELRELLAGQGVGVAISTLWGVFARRKITLKKSPGMPRSRIVPTLSAAAGSGSTANSTSTRSG
jgi:hypothetical protein